MKEIEIIRNLFADRQMPEDDCFAFAGKYLISTDSMVEGTHFVHEWSSPASLAIKLLEVNISDITASGGRSELAFLNLGLSKVSSQSEWLLPFSRRLRMEMAKYGIRLAGGDTFSAPATFLSMTLLGKYQQYISRQSARPGDFLYIIGTIGLSLWGYRQLKKKQIASSKFAKQAILRHLRPRSYFRQMQTIQSDFAVHAAMDITDGLWQDLHKMAEASHVGLEVHLQNIPFFLQILSYLSVSDSILSGEELAIVFSCSEKIPDFYQNLPVKHIGYVKDHQSVEFYFFDELIKPEKIGFSHFTT